MIYYVLHYVIFSSVGGLEEEQDYEYHAVEGECHFNKIQNGSNQVLE